MKIKKSIFFIEDDPGIVDVYTMAFGAAKIDTKIFTSGKEVLEALKNVQQEKAPKPSLILLDLMLPDISGAEIFKEIKNHQVTADIPVFITSNYTLNQVPEAGDLQPEKFILKTDITPTNLVALVKQQLGE